MWIPLLRHLINAAGGAFDWLAGRPGVFGWEFLQNDGRAPCVVVRNAVDIPSILLV